MVASLALGLDSAFMEKWVIGLGRNLQLSLFD